MSDYSLCIDPHWQNYYNALQVPMSQASQQDLTMEALIEPVDHFVDAAPWPETSHATFQANALWQSAVPNNYSIDEDDIAAISSAAAAPGLLFLLSRAKIGAGLRAIAAAEIPPEGGIDPSSQQEYLGNITEVLKSDTMILSPTAINALSVLAMADETSPAWRQDLRRLVVHLFLDQALRISRADPFFTTKPLALVAKAEALLTEDELAEMENPNRLGIPARHRDDLGALLREARPIIIDPYVTWVTGRENRIPSVNEVPLEYARGFAVPELKAARVVAYLQELDATLGPIAEALDAYDEGRGELPAVEQAKQAFSRAALLWESLEIAAQPVTWGSWQGPERAEHTVPYFYALALQYFTRLYQQTANPEHAAAANYAADFFLDSLPRSDPRFLKPEWIRDAIRNCAARLNADGKYRETAILAHELSTRFERNWKVDWFALRIDLLLIEGKAWEYAGNVLPLAGDRNERQQLVLYYGNAIKAYRTVELYLSPQKASSQERAEALRGTIRVTGKLIPLIIPELRVQEQAALDAAQRKLDAMKGRIPFSVPATAVASPPVSQYAMGVIARFAEGQGYPLGQLMRAEIRNVGEVETWAEAQEPGILLRLKACGYERGAALTSDTWAFLLVQEVFAGSEEWTREAAQSRMAVVTRAFSELPRADLPAARTLQGSKEEFFERGEHPHGK